MKVHCDQQSPVRRIRLALEPNRDTITVSQDSLDAIAQVVADANDDSTCRILLFDAPVGGFCHGMDLESIATADAADRARGIASYVECMNALRTSQVAVVAAVDGVALGAGVGLAASADFVVATQRSRFGLPEALLGLAPAIVLTPLLDRMAPQKVRRMALLASTVSAADAYHDGLVDEVVSNPAELEAAVRRIARQVKRTDRHAGGVIKALCHQLAHLDPVDALELGARCTRDRLANDERRSAILAFTDAVPLPP